MATMCLQLSYTPRSPVPGRPFTEASFTRQCATHTCELAEIGLALVDVWNFGWPDGPVGPTLGPELSVERGTSHAARKRSIVQERIVPAVAELRALGVPIFHCTNADLLERYPQWLASATPEERDALRPRPVKSRGAPHPASDAASGGVPEETWPPVAWVQAWRDAHRDRVYDDAWTERQNREVGWQFDLAPPVRPMPCDLLVGGRDQFSRLLRQRRVRILFYMGFEADECLQFKPYGMASMSDLGYLCVVVRDCTTTYETAETVAGLWKSRVAIAAIEARWGYSITSDELRRAVRLAAGAA